MAAVLTDPLRTRIGQRIKRLESLLSDPSPALNAIADDVILGPQGALARNYRNAGIKQHTGLLFRGITQRNAPGNYVQLQGSRVTVGVMQTRELYYVKWVLEGRGPVVATKAKALAFMVNGKLMFRKRVKAAPARPVYYLLPQDVQKAQVVAHSAVMTRFALVA